MFRRSSSTSTAASESHADSAAQAPEEGPKSVGKGRPTPKRREAEAAARARAKAPLDRREGMRRERQRRAENSRKVRDGIKAGDDRYLPKRDRGPVRRFVRDFVDHRLCMAEFSIPLLFASLLLSATGSPLGAGIMNGTLLVVVLDSLLLRFRLRRELRRRFPDEDLKGTTLYAFMRSLQLRFLRLPKTQVRLGEALPDRYR